MTPHSHTHFFDFDGFPQYGEAVAGPGEETYRELSLCDVTDTRMLDWLEDVINEDDFSRMSQFGVEVLRVPTGYWNWIYLGNLSPNAPREVAERFRHLQNVQPWKYEKYIDRIYQWGAQYNVKIMMEIHGMPGSQSGKGITGCTIKDEEGQEQFYFNTTWNKELALRTVRKMSEKCLEFQSSCYGVGVINEPAMGKGASKEEKEIVHDFLDDYFDEAIKEARKILPWETPVILFSWTFDFWRWPANRFPYTEYGRVEWDTHLYTFWRDDGTSDDVDQVLSLYDEPIASTAAFQNKQNASVIIGEFTFANFK